MPRLSRWFVRASLIYLVIGFTLGGLVLFHKGIPLHPLLWQVLPAHIEFLLLGWTVQLAMGVAFWILPRFGGSRGDEKPVWAAFILVNIGVWLVGLGLSVRAPALIPFLGRVAEVGGVTAFAFHIWPRIKRLGA